MTLPRFSILMPAYNAAETIGDAVKSIIEQTFSDWELIIVDDGSTDSTSSIVNGFAETDRRIRVITHYNNLGSALKARLTAANDSHGEYLVEIDSDDTISPRFLEKIDRAITDTGSDIILSRMHASNHKREFIIPDENDVATGSFLTGIEALNMTLINWRINLNGFAVRKEIYTRICRNLPDKTTKLFCADEVASRLMLAASIHVTQTDATYYYKLRPISTSQDPDKLTEMLEADCDLYEQLKRISEPQKTIHLANKRLASLRMLADERLTIQQKKRLKETIYRATSLIGRQRAFTLRAGTIVWLSLILPTPIMIAILRLYRRKKLSQNG